MVPLGVYFINVEVQSYLGRKALSETGLTVNSLPAALEKAERGEKLVLVDVSAIWCATCRKLDREVFADRAVKAEIERGFVFSRLEYETEEGREFIEARNVKGFPTLWVLDEKGKTLKQLYVTFDPSEFIDQLRAVELQVSNSVSRVNR